MKYIKQYHFFINETVLATNDSFKKILNDINHPIASQLMKLIGTDIKTNYNALKTTDKNDQVEFISNNQYIKLEKELSPDKIFNKKGNISSIGRIVRSILKDSSITFTDSDIEGFVNLYKAKHDELAGETEKIRVVSGKEIKYWYDADNYSRNFDTGTLYNSCMRYKKCEPYFDIYTENPEQCSMVIYLDDQNQLLARALLWKLSYSSKEFDYYLDRIYYTKDSQVQLLKQWMRDNKKFTNVGFHGEATGSMSVKLNNSDFDYYPYVDTLYYLNTSTSTLYNEQEDGCDVELQDTSGGTSIIGTYCEYEEQTFPDDECVWSKHHNVAMHADNARYSDVDQDYYWYGDAVYSKYKDSWLLKEKCSYSKHLDDWLPDDESYLVYLDSERDESDYYPDENYKDLFDMDETSGDYYLLELLTEIDDEYFLTNDLLDVYKVSYDTGFGVIEHMNEFDASVFEILLDDIEKSKMLKKKYEVQFFTNIIYDKFKQELGDKLIKAEDEKQDTSKIINILERLHKYNRKNGINNDAISDTNYYYNNLIFTKYTSYEDARDQIYDDLYVLSTEEVKHHLQDKTLSQTKYVIKHELDLNLLYDHVFEFIKIYTNPLRQLMTDLGSPGTIIHIFDRIGEKQLGVEHYGDLIYDFGYRICYKVREHKTLYKEVRALRYMKDKYENKSYTA